MLPLSIKAQRVLESRPSLDSDVTIRISTFPASRAHAHADRHQAVAGPLPCVGQDQARGRLQRKLFVVRLRGEDVHLSHAAIRVRTHADGHEIVERRLEGTLTWMLRQVDEAV